MKNQIRFVLAALLIISGSKMAFAMNTYLLGVRRWTK